MKETCTKLVFLFILFLSWFPAQRSWAQAISTVTGNGTNGGAGDGAPATNASVRALGIALDASGNIYIADTDHHRIRKVNIITKIITTVAGNGVSGYSGDGGAATNASLKTPYDVAVAANGDIYIADNGNNRIRKVSAIDGKISTVAGNGYPGYSGDGGAATSARIYGPAGLALDASGNLYLSEYNGHRIRKVTLSTNIIHTVAGTLTSGYNGDNRPASTASLKNPWGIAIDVNGNIFFADYGNSRIRKINAGDGLIHTVAGTGIQGFSGDGSLATAASIGTPTGIVVTGSGHIYFSERDGNRIRKVSASDGTISTVAGTGEADYFGDGGPATLAKFNAPSGIEVDSDGNIFVADYGNARIRRIEGFVNNGLALPEGALGTLNKAMLEFTDTNQPPSAITYTLTAAVKNGTLFRDANQNSLADAGEELVATSLFTQSDVDAGSIKYQHNGSETATDDFSFSISDNAGKTLKDKLFIFTIVKVNDAPSITDYGSDSGTTPEDTDLALTGLQMSDAEAGFEMVLLDLVAAHGIIKVKGDVAGGVADYEILGNHSKLVTLMASLPAINATLAANGVVYSPDLNFNGQDSVLLILDDNATFITGSGGPKKAKLSRKLVITPVNDKPVITSNGGGATAAISMPEKVNAVTTVTATDVEKDVITYSVTGGADQAWFSIDSNSGALVFVTAPDFRAPADADADNTYVVTVRATDNGPGNEFAEQTITVTILDNTPPTITGIRRKTPEKATTKATSLTYSLTFVEPVSGVDAGDFILTKTGTATGSSLEVTGSGTSYEVTINGVSGDGTLRLDVKASGTGIVDQSGLGLPAGFAEGHRYFIDNTPPVVTGVEPGKFYGNNRLIGFNEGEATLNGAPFAAGSTVSPEGGYTLVVTDSVAQTTTVPFAIDKTPSTGALIINQQAVHTNHTGVTLHVTADDGAGAGIADMRFSNDKSNWTAWEPFAAVKAYVLPAGDGLKTVYLQLRDKAGNVSNAISDDIALDQTRPTASLANIAAEPTNLNPIPITIQFSEPVTGFDLSDITLSGGTKQALTGNGTDYSFTITPAGTGPITVEVAAGVAHDQAANGNTAAAQLLINYDGVKPTVTLATVAADPTNLNLIPVTVTFSEPVTGFDLADVVVVGGTKGGLIGSGANYIFTIAPAGAGLVTASIAANVAADAATNGNQASNTLSRSYDATKPILFITAPPVEPVRTAFTATFTFSEPVTGFALEDITIENGLVSNFLALSATMYTALITPGPVGLVKVDVAANVAQDGTGNGNLAAASLLVEDVTCGNRKDKVLVCHNGQVICIALSSLKAHLAHGDKIGSCTSVVRPDEKMDIEVNQWKDLDLKIYPNPAKGNTNIEFTIRQAGRFNLGLFDLTGKLVKNIATGSAASQQFFFFDLDVSKYPVGLYMIRLTTDREVATKRLIVQK